MSTNSAVSTAPAGSVRTVSRRWLWGVWIIWCIGASLAALWIAENSRFRNGRGDGQNIESYGFDLRDSLVSLARIEASGSARDDLPAPLDPPVISAEEITPQTRLAGVRKLRSTERVVGVVINGQARAYPLWILVWHEVVNDTLAGCPIAVTYNGLCDSIAVFDRRVAGEQGEEILTFGFSGLLMNSNLLLFDRCADASQESLWSQLQARAISGPAARRGAELRILPCTVVTWQEWRSRYPKSTVMLPDPHRKEYYKRDPYTSYLGSDELRFQVQPLPSRAERPYKYPIVALQTPQGWRVVPADRANSTIDLATQEYGVMYSFWFAWYAAHPETAISP